MRVRLAVVVVCVLVPSSAAAEWTVAAYLGVAKTMAAPLSIVQPASGTDVTLTPLRYRGESFTPPLYYGGRVTWFATQVPWLGIESEFIHLKAYADTDAEARISGTHLGTPAGGSTAVRTVIERFSISHGLNFLLFNAVVRHRVFGGMNGRRVTLFGRGGLGPTIPHAESIVSGVSREGYAWGRAGYQAAGGAEVRIAMRIGVLAEYKVTRTRQRLEIDRGEARSGFTSHHAVFGVTWSASRAARPE